MLLNWTSAIVNIGTGVIFRAIQFIGASDVLRENGGGKDRTDEEKNGWIVKLHSRSESQSKVVEVALKTTKCGLVGIQVLKFSHEPSFKAQIPLRFRQVRVAQERELLAEPRYRRSASSDNMWRYIHTRRVWNNIYSPKNISNLRI